MKTAIFILMCLIATTTYSQKKGRYTGNGSGGTYLSLSTGINNKAGLFGLSLNHGLNKTTALDFALGIGTWGYKATISIENKPRSERKFFWAAGISFASGLQEFTTEMEMDNGLEEEVVLVLNPVVAINLSVGNKYTNAKGNYFYWQAGYSIRIQGNEDIYKQKSPTNRSISRNSELALGVLAPGGIIASLGYAFRL